VAVAASVSDPIPVGTTYVQSGASSGYPVPLTAPFGSTNIGVSCTDSSAETTTTLCYYEAPTGPFPDGRIIWSGTIGPDFGAEDATEAVNEIRIVFNVDVGAGVETAYNLATINSDLNGDGDATDPGEQNVASADAIWSLTTDIITELPSTGFAPGKVTSLPPQALDKAYSLESGLWLEVPGIRLKTPILGVPLSDGEWDVTWLGTYAGWLNSTAYPSTPGNSVITGHVYLSSGAPGPFVNIKNLKWGDQVLLHIDGLVYVYEVRSSAQVKPANLSALRHEDLSWITLITCQGFNAEDNSYAFRTVVRAVLVSIRSDSTRTLGVR
jgi:LPXTG-site transpeptidase (sortase) family protein